LAVEMYKEDTGLIPGPGKIFQRRPRRKTGVRVEGFRTPASSLCDFLSNPGQWLVETIAVDPSHSSALEKEGKARIASHGIQLCGPLGQLRG